MKLIYYKADIGNFGDDLNKWLWPKIFGADFFDDSKETCFVGIGSILNENSNLMQSVQTYPNKYIFGSGVRSINTNLKFDNSYNAIFYRGPFSALKMEGSADNFISDAAYAIAFTGFYKRIMLENKKRYEVSFIPYFRSESKVDWKKMCLSKGWNYISPTDNNLELTLTEIAQSRHIITEAMHGAILADAFRVPWKRVRFHAHINETEAVSEFKWNDWLSSIGINCSYYKNLSHLPSKSFIKQRLFKSQLETEKYQSLRKQLIASFESGDNFQLSTKQNFDTVISKLNNAIKIFKSLQQ
jgi:succinoglycan biosynthesis protein ExoV